jgi:D-sedoheptulose 7-phosphate isomerase
MNKHLSNCIARYPALASCADSMAAALDAICTSYHAGGKLLLAGNGGSSSDCDHIAGELLKGFCSKRPIPQELRADLESRWGADGSNMAAKLQRGLPAWHLGQATGLASAWANDVDSELLYAQMLLAVGRKNDVLLGISTGGGAKNILSAFRLAPSLGIKTILLTGNKNGACVGVADIVIAVPESETYKIQELHLPVYHAVALAIEEEFFG